MADADPDLPDPAKLRDLAARWQAIANQLADLAATVTSSVSGTNWTGDGKNAAMTAAGGVSTVIGQAATNAQAMADGLNDFAGKIEDALKAEEASFWATLIGALLDIASLGLAGIFTAAIKALSELLVEVLTAVGAELETATVLANFAANAFVFGGFSAISNITTQLSSEAIAGEHLHVDPLSVGISVLDGGLTAGLIGPAFTGGRNVGAVPHGDIGEVPALGGQHGVPNVVDEVNPNAVRGSGIRLEPPPAVEVGNVNVGKIGADGGLVGAVRAPTPASTVSRALPGVTDEGVALPTTVRPQGATPVIGEGAGNGPLRPIGATRVEVNEPTPLPGVGGDGVIRPPRTPGEVSVATPELAGQQPIRTSLHPANLDAGGAVPGRLGSVDSDLVRPPTPVNDIPPSRAGSLGGVGDVVRPPTSVGEVPSSRAGSLGGSGDVVRPPTPANEVPPTRAGSLDSPGAVVRPPSPAEPVSSRGAGFDGRSNAVTTPAEPQAPIPARPGSLDAGGPQAVRTGEASAGPQFPARGDVVAGGRPEPGPYSGNKALGDLVRQARETPPDQRPVAEGSTPLPPGRIQPTRAGRGFDYPATMDNGPAAPVRAEPGVVRPDTPPVEGAGAPQAPVSFPGRGSSPHGGGEPLAGNKALGDAVLEARATPHDQRPVVEGSTPLPPGRIQPTRAGRGFDHPATMDNAPVTAVRGESGPLRSETPPPEGAASAGAKPPQASFPGKPSSLKGGGAEASVGNRALGEAVVRARETPLDQRPVVEGAAPRPGQVRPTREGRGFDYPATMDNAPAGRGGGADSGGGTALRPPGSGTRTELEHGVGGGTRAGEAPASAGLKQEPASFPGKPSSLEGGSAEASVGNRALGEAVVRARETPLDQRPVVEGAAAPRPGQVRPTCEGRGFDYAATMDNAPAAGSRAHGESSAAAGTASHVEGAAGAGAKQEPVSFPGKEHSLRSGGTEASAENKALGDAVRQARDTPPEQRPVATRPPAEPRPQNAPREQVRPVRPESRLVVRDGMRPADLARRQAAFDRASDEAGVPRRQLTGSEQHRLADREAAARATGVERAQQANIARNQALWRAQERDRLQTQRQHWQSVSEDDLAAHFQARREQLGHGTEQVDAERLVRFRADVLARVEGRLAKLDAPARPAVPRQVVRRPVDEAAVARAQRANIARNEQVWREQEQARLEARQGYLSSVSNEELAPHFQALREQLGYAAGPVDAQRLARFRADALARVDDRLASLDAPRQAIARRVVVRRPVDDAAVARAQQANIARNEQVWREQDGARAAAYRARVEALSPGLDDGLAITVRDNTIVVHGAGVRPDSVPVRSGRRTTIVVDPSVTSTAAVRRFIDGLPADRAGALTVEYPPPKRPITPAAATDLATRLLGGLDGRGALVLPVGALAGRAPQDGYLVPVDAGNQVTFAEIAERYYVHPADRPAPPRTPLDLPPGARPGTYQLVDGWEVAQTPVGLHIRPPGSGQPVLPADVAAHRGPRIVVGEPDLELPPRVRVQVSRLLQRLPERPDLRIVEHGPDPYLVPLAAGLPAGYQLTAVPRGVVLHRDGTAPAPDTVAQAARHAVPDGLTVLVDPSVTDLRAVDRYVRGLPVQPDRLVTVVLPTPDRAYPPRRAIRVADWLGGATKAPARVLYPSGAINERPEPGGRLLPVTARGAATFPELAEHVTVLPGDAPPIAPHGLKPAGAPGAYRLVDGWVVEQKPAGLWVRPAALDAPMPAFEGDGPRVVVGGPGVALAPAALAELSRALAPILPPRARPQWHVDLADPPGLPLPPGVHLRQTATGVVLYQAEAPDSASLAQLPARPRAGQLAVVVDRSVTDPAGLRPVLDALRDAGSSTLVVRLAGPVGGVDLAGLADALLGGHGVLSVPADGVAGPPPATVPVDALGRATFPALAQAYQVGPAAAPYGLELGEQPGTYRLPEGWVVGGTGAQVWARPAGFAGTEPVAPEAPATPDGRPRIVVGAPGIEVPLPVLRLVANVAARTGSPELVAPARSPIGPQARHRPLPEGVRAVPGIDGLYALPAASGQQAGTRAVLNAYAAGGDLPDQVAHPATVLVVDGPVDPATRTVQTAAGPLSPAQLIGLLLAMPHGPPDTVVFTDPGARAAGTGGVSLADLLAGTAPVSVIAPAGEVELTEQWRLGAAGGGWYQHRGLGTRPLGPVLAYPAPWDGTTAPPARKAPGEAPENASEKAPGKAPGKAPAEPVAEPDSEDGTGSVTTDSEVASVMLDIDDAVESEVDSTEPTSLASDGGAKRLAEVAGWTGWRASPAKDHLTDPARRALESLGLHGLADEPGVSLFTKVAVSGGYLGDLPLRQLAAAPVQAWNMAVRDLARQDKERAGSGWPVFGLAGMTAETVTEVEGWLDGGFEPALAPAVLLKGLPPETAGVEVLLRLFATLLGRRIRLVRADGGSVEYGTAGDAPVVTLVQDRYGVLGTVPYEAVPALLAPKGSHLVRPVVSATPTALPNDGLAFGDLPGFLAAISGATDVTLPEPAELPRRLREAAQPGGGEVTPGPGLAATLERVRTAIATQARPVPATEPVEWEPAPPELNDPNVLTGFQAGYLADLGRSAVWTPAGPNAFFAALVRAGEHDQHRLLGLAGWSPAELRWMFGGLVQADLAATGNAWPLLGADPARLAEYRADLLDWVAQLATPGADEPEHLPEALARTVAELFGVRVVLVEPHRALPEVAPSTGDPATLPVLHLVVDAGGHTMATVASAGRPGTVVQPLAASGKPPAGKRPPATEHIQLVEFNRPPAKGRPSGPPAPSRPSGSKPAPSSSIKGKGRPSGPPPQGPAPVPRPVVNLDPLVYPMGIPKATLPYLDQVVAKVRSMAQRHRAGVTEDEWAALPQRLLSNYRAVSGSGLVVPLGRVEVLFRLDLSNPRVAHNPAASVDRYVSAESVDDDATQPAVGNARFRANQSTQGTFQTGAHGQTSSGQAGAFRAKVSLTAALGLDPAVVQVAKLGFSVSGIANKVDRSTSHIKDAETGHVEDTRDDSTLLELDADWSIRFRFNPRRAWQHVTDTRLDRHDATGQSLFLWVPNQYLQQPPGALAVASAPPVPKQGATPAQQAAQRAFLDRLSRIPDTFFASNLTGLPELYDNVVARLTEAGIKAKPGGLLRNQLMQALWNLDTHLDTAVNDPRGYRFTLGRRGQPVAEVTVHTRRSRHLPVPVGATSKKAHLEKVRTAISGHSSGFTLGQESSFQLTGEVDLVPVPGLSLGPQAYAAWTYDNSDGLSAGRNGLWVLVSRYSGYTSAYDIGLTHQATVTVRNRPNLRSLPTAPVAGRALLRIPEPDAFAYGFPIDKAAFRQHPGAANFVPYTDDALRANVGIPATGVTLPAHVRRGHGVGQALVKVDRHVVEEMLDEVIPPLQRHGFLPPDLDRPFRSRAATGKLRKAGARSSKLDNLELLYKMISGEALDTHYNDIHADGNGMSFTLRRRSGGTVTSARVTVTAEQVLSGRTDRATGNSVHFRRRTGEYHVVNLAMGLDIAGQSAGGSQKFTLGAKAGLGFTALPHLRTFSMGVEYDRSIGASESATTITNTPQLMEYPGDVDEFRLPSRYRVTIDFEDDAIPQVVTPLMPATATVHLLPHFNVDPPAPQAAPQSAPQAPQSAPKATPKASPKATTSGGSALPPPPSLFDASLFEAGFASLDAQLASLNAPPTARYPITGPARTPHEVLDQAVVYYLDTSGVLAAARRQEPRLTRPGKAADQEVVNFTSNISMTAHLKEIVHGEYTTDTLFEPGILRDEHAALSISGQLGGSEFAGVAPEYTLGLIKLVLTQAGQTASRSHGITWNQLDVAGGSDVTSPHLASAAGEATSAHRWGRSETRGLRQTGGKEFLELNFQRAYAFRTVVDFDVRGAHEKRSKLLPHLKMVRAGETVANREMIYLLSEPDALEQFAEGRVPIPDTQLADVFARWSAGTTSLSASILARVLARWETLHRTSAAGAPDPHALARVAWAARLARQHASDAVPIRDPAARQAFQNTFRALSLQAKPAAPVTLFSAGTSAKGAVPPKGPQPPTGSPATFVPPYLTKRGPRAVGHAGFHKLSYSGTRKTTFDLVYEAVQEAAPGLLGQRQPDWRATGGQVWWSLAGPEPVIGRLQGGIDALQAMLSGGREQALIEDLLSSNGMRFYLVNPMGWLLSDVVELTVRMELLSTPEIVDFIPDNGLENYLHGYTEVSRSRGRDSTQAYTVAKAGLGGTHGTSGGPEVHLGGGQHRSTKQADENIVEQTVYDWTGHYRARVRHRLLIDVRRVKMAGRGINNQLATWVRNRSGVQPVHRHHDGELILKIPRGLAEAAPVFGPAPPPSFTPLPPLPADSLVSAVLLDDALPTAEHLMRVAFGESADTAEFRTSLSLPLLLSRSHLGGHLLKALAGKTHTLATDLFVPGHSSDRAELSMSGDLYDMQVISRVDNTGTGRYAKYLSTTSANVANDRWNTSVVGGVDQGGTTEVLDPQNADKPWAHNAADSSTGAARQAPPGIAGGGANNPRREQHIKQQGQVYLVKVRGRFFLELARFRHEVTGDPRPLGAITSEPITGDIFLEMFADEIEEMRRYLDLHHLTAATEAPPAWDGVDITREDEDLNMWLTRAAVAGANAWEAPVDVARMLREPRTRQRPLRLTVDAGARAYQIHEAIAEWEIASLRATDRATANLRQAELDAAGAALRAEATTLANGLALLTKRINTIIARVSLARRARQGPRPLPPVVPVLSIDPVQAARQIAQELDTYVEVVESFPGGGQAIHRVDRLGRIFRVHADGTPFTLDEAIRLLPGELQRRIRTERLGRAVLVDLYQNSWIRQQSFEQAVSAALGPPPPVVRPPGKVTKPDPSLPPPKDPPVKAPLFGSPTSGSPTSGSPTLGSPTLGSPRLGSPASESTVERPAWRPPVRSGPFVPPSLLTPLVPPEIVPPEAVLSGGTLSGIGSGPLVPAPPAAQESPPVPPKDPPARRGEDAQVPQPAPVVVTGDDKPVSAPPDPAARAAMLTRALGEDGYALLLEDAAGILRRVGFGVADHEVFAEHFPDLARDTGSVGADLTAVDQIRSIVGMDRLVDVAEARIASATRAEAIARQVGREWGVADDEVQPPSFVDLNRPLPNQVQPLRDLGRYAAWTPPDGDCWFTSVVNAAQDRADQSGVVGELAWMSATELRTRLGRLLDADPEVLRQVRSAAPNEEEYRRFRGELATPTRWGNDLFDTLFQYAPRLLGIRIVVVNVDGNPVAYGRATDPALYLVRTGNHYMPALRSPGGAYLAYHWLAGNQPGPAPTLAGLTGEQRDRARQLHIMSATVLAQVVRHELTVPGLTTEAPAMALPQHLPPGTRIWMATADGRIRAAWRASYGTVHTFDPHDGTTGQITPPELAQWVGAEPHTFVVARPATVSRSPDTRTAIPTRGGARGGPSTLRPVGRHGWMPGTSSSTGVTTGEPTSSGVVGGSTLATTVLPPARLAPQPVSATVSTTVAPVLTPAVREEPPAPTTSEAPPPARSGTTADLTAPSAVVVQGHLSSPRGSSTGSSLDHLRTLSGSSRRSATAPPDPRRLVEDWLAAGDWPASMEFFAAYRTALHTPQAREALGRLVEAGAGRAAVLAALLDERFAGHGEIGYRYLIAATPDEGLDVVLPELVEQPDLIEAMAALIEAVDGGQRQLDYHAVMLRATGLALAGRAEEAVRLVRGVRGRIPGKPKLAWVDRLKNAGGGDQPAVAAVGQVREELMLCGIPSKS